MELPIRVSYSSKYYMCFLKVRGFIMYVGDHTGKIFRTIVWNANESEFTIFKPSCDNADIAILLYEKNIDTNSDPTYEAVCDIIRNEVSTDKKIVRHYTGFDCAIDEKKNLYPRGEEDIYYYFKDN